MYSHFSAQVLCAYSLYEAKGAKLLRESSKAAQSTTEHYMWHMATTKDTIGLTVGWYSWRMLTQSVETVFLTTRRCIVLKGRAVKFEVPLADVINLDLDQMGVFDRTSRQILPKLLFLLSRSCSKVSLRHQDQG
jgi:hypothetical protein